MNIKKILFLLTLFLVLPFTKVNAEELTIDFFYGNGCPYCAKENKDLNVLKYQLGDNLNIRKYEVWENDKNLELLTSTRKALNDNKDSVPFLVVGDKHFTGFNDDIAKDIKQAIFDNLKQNNLNVVDIVKKDSTLPNDLSLQANPTIKFSLLGRVDASKVDTGLVALTEGISDAINLGSLWIILFLFGILLSVYNKKKRWILGSIFVLASTITYSIFVLTNAEFTVNQTSFIRSFVSIIAIIIAAISIDAHMKINIPKKSILQRLQELFGKKQMLVYAIAIIITSVIATFTLVNQAGSSPALFKIVLDIQNITGTSYVMNMLLYFFSYLIATFILFAVVNIIVKEIFIENTIGTYNRLIAGIVMLVAAAILLFIPGAFMMVTP